MPKFPSPNHGDRRGQKVELIVLHYTGMRDGASARARLCDPEAEVSAHWLVHEDGACDALVPEDRRAWHAGQGAWQGRDDVNSRSVGIEIVNPGDRPFPMRQMDGVAGLIAQISRRYSLEPSAVIGHADIAPGRKIDPGCRFDWAVLARRGLVLWSEPGADLPLSDSLTAIGYPAAPTEIRLASFRMRFRPWAHGPECAADRRLASGLAAKLRGC